ncbi:hypothetical protein [Enterobacter hormaechei]|uniref:hypothetical protein n=1 Tax=Enterobacter hormaechei TaxID=158836 RepID=UPI0032181916
MKKYLYLTKKNWIHPWITGGVVPLYRASKYISDERKGVYTPDENLIDTSTHDKKDFSDLFVITGNSRLTVQDFYHKGSYYEHVVFDQKIENGLVLCLANTKSREIAIGLGKEACVEILDVELLKRHLDKQIGVNGIMKPCEYTSGHNRNHFLKSSKDAWQDEYRIFWPEVESLRVSIPSGIAKHVKLNFHKK